MSDLINRQDAIDAVHYYIESGYKCDIFQELKNLPSAETTNTNIAMTLKCGCSGEINEIWSNWKYCPRCGARLEWK